LTAKGQLQAAAAAEALRDIPFSHAYASEFPRARQTAEIILSERNLMLAIDARLNERRSGLDGQPVERFGYLIVSVGAAATISHRTSRSRWLKKLGEIAYLLMTPAVTLGYRHRDVAVSVDGGPAETRLIFTLMVANTENGGGGMKLMPGARFDDGVLDLIEMGDISRPAILFGVMPKLYSGAHVRHPKVRVSQGRTFRFDSAAETLVDLDGETVGRLPLEVSVLPRAFNVGVP
jgi:diacylglycerol kinase family enzyme